MKTPARVLVEQVRNIRESGRFAARSNALPTWCPGCGYFGIHQGLNDCIAELGLSLHDVVTVSGIGCAGRYAFFSSTYGLHMAHGRTLPTATGIKLANPRLTVFAIGGDGDGLAIGAAHFPHIARRNINVNYLLFDNSIYGLTKGQPSPTSPVGSKTKASPYGTLDSPLNATLMALTYGASFVARLFAGDPKGITEALIEGIKNPGFSIFHIYTSCVTFDKTFKTWTNLKKWVHPLPKGYDPTDMRKAFDEVLSDDFSMGIIYNRGEQL
jgi:2-oxoglutarate/2-oxoacid ferredoxin oxidoreductase subunit beta